MYIVAVLPKLCKIMQVSYQENKKTAPISLKFWWNDI